MWALIYRRLELVAQGIGDVVVFGSMHAAIRSASANSSPERSSLCLHRSRSEDGVQHAGSFPRRRRGHPGAQLPQGTAAEEPDQPGIATASASTRPSRTTARRDRGGRPGRARRRSLRRVGRAGVLVLDRTRPAGRPGPARASRTTSASRGVSGQELTARALTQAQRFGAEILVARGAMELSCERKPYAVRKRWPGEPAKTVIIATGAEYQARSTICPGSKGPACITAPPRSNAGLSRTRK